MTKTKRYKRTVFTAHHLRDAISTLGESIKLQSAEVTRDNISESYHSLQDFLDSYAKGCSSAYICVESKKGHIRLHLLSNGSNITVDSDDTEFVERTLSLLDSFAPSAEMSGEYEAFKPLAVEQFCLVSPLHWESLPHLPSRLKKYGITISEQIVSVTRYPKTIRYTDWESVLADIRQGGEPLRFVIKLQGKLGARHFSLTVSKSTYANSDERYMCLDISGVPEIQMIDDIAAFLGLQPDQLQPYPKKDRTAFIAHRFDDLGEQLADRLARFLSLIGFDVKTGRGFSPKPVSEKVKERLDGQSIIFVIVTPGDDATWLTQESVLSHSRDKPLFVLRDANTDFKPGLLGDLEYIPFSAPRIEATFIAILEGLNELEFLNDSGN